MNSTEVRRTFALIDRQHSDMGEAVRIGAPRETLNVPIGTQPVSLPGHTREAELYRLRTASHLYDEAHVESSLDLERAVAARMGLLLADCHACRLTLHIQADADTCPTCGTAL